MTNIDQILLEVIEDVKQVGFPVPVGLSKTIIIDKHRYDRVAACRSDWRNNTHEIHLSEDTLRASEKDIKNIIAHEVLHSHILTANHSIFWKMYCKFLRDKFGYNIQEKYDWLKLVK